MFRRSDVWGVVVAYLVIAVLIAIPAYLQRRDIAAAHAQAAELEQRIQAAQSEPKPVEKNVIQGTPVRMVIERLGIDLTVVRGEYDSANQTWSVKDGAGNFASNTYPMNDDKGVTLIYGHNNIYTLGKTKKLEVGDKLLVTTDNGHIFSYVFTGDTVVSPTDTTLFGELDTEEPVLKLMTCSGKWFESRRLMTFKLEGAV